ncbi:MAG: SPASM domain-containing protein, partial [Pseudomonadales bacterium]
VAAYYAKKAVVNKTIICYLYGGEPTTMGKEYFEETMAVINLNFPKSEGYTVKTIVLSSLLGVDLDVWEPLIQEHCNGYIQTSFDGFMRGKGYVRHWEKAVRDATQRGLRVATISVINSELLKDGPKKILDYLCELGITEISFLPFMLNEQNAGKKYDRYAPTMNNFSSFMIELFDHWGEKCTAGMQVPHVGEAVFIAYTSQQGRMANMAGQTLFLLPDGEFVLPNYKDGWKEYMYSFGNILGDGVNFEDILHSPERIKYLGRQLTRNNNPECKSCAYKNACLLEFAKPNKPDDECFGASQFVQHVLTSPYRDLLDDTPTLA